MNAQHDQKDQEINPPKPEQPPLETDIETDFWIQSHLLDIPGCLGPILGPTIGRQDNEEQ